MVVCCCALITCELISDRRYTNALHCVKTGRSVWQIKNANTGDENNVGARVEGCLTTQRYGRREMAKRKEVTRKMAFCLYNGESTVGHSG